MYILTFDEAMGKYPWGKEIELHHFTMNMLFNVHEERPGRHTYKKDVTLMHTIITVTFGGDNTVVQGWSTGLTYHKSVNFVP